MPIQFRNTSFVAAVTNIEDAPKPDRPEIVFSGKSNVGKSSLINAIADNSKLARISGEPGKTRLVLYFDVDDRLYLVDLPGYGFAKAPKSVQEKYKSLVDRYFSVGRPISLVLHLMDIRRQPSDQDLLMISYMKSRNIPFFIVFTKVDKISSAAARKNVDDYLHIMELDPSVSIFGISSSVKKGIEDLRKGISAFLESSDG